MLGVYIDGKNGYKETIHFMSYPTGRHEKIIVKLTKQFEDGLVNTPCCSAFGPTTGLFIGHRFEHFEHLKSIQKAFKEHIKEGKQYRASIAPDLMIICNYKWSDFTNKGYIGIPKLVVEIFSPSTGADDLGWKKDIYEAIGVQEYWVIEDIQNVDVFKLVDGEYELTRYHNQEDEDILEIPSQIFEGLVVKLNRRDILDYE